MENFNFDFKFNFKKLDLEKLFREDRITQDEIIHVFENSNRILEEGDPSIENTIFIQIGYTPKKRITLIAYKFDQVIFDFIGAKVAEEFEIENYYCGK